MSSRRLLSTSETAIYIGRTVGWLAKARVYGSGPIFVKLGQRVFYDGEDLNGWIEKIKYRSTSDCAGSPQATP